MRIPNNTLMYEMQRYAMDNRDKYSAKVTQLSSSRKYSKQSDDPVATDEIKNVKAENAKIEQWRQNLINVEGWEKASEARINNITSYMQRFRELAVQANNGSNSADDRKNIAIEINEILEGMSQEANASHIGTPMFAGAGINPTYNSTFEITRNANDEITAVTYRGSQNKRMIQIADTSTNNTIDYGLTGQELFEGVSAPYPGDPNVSIFDLLIKVRDELAQGDKLESFDDAGNNPLHLRGDFAKIEASLDHVVQKVVYNSVSQRRIDRLISDMDSAESSGIQHLAKIEDLDVTAAMTELTQLQTALQASLQLIPKATNLTILNYL